MACSQFPGKRLDPRQFGITRIQRSFQPVDHGRQQIVSIGRHNFNFDCDRRIGLNRHIMVGRDACCGLQLLFMRLSAFSNGGSLNQFGFQTGIKTVVDQRHRFVFGNRLGNGCFRGFLSNWRL